MVEYVMADRENILQKEFVNEEHSKDENSLEKSSSKVDLNNLIQT